MGIYQHFTFPKVNAGVPRASTSAGRAGHALFPPEGITDLLAERDHRRHIAARRTRVPRWVISDRFPTRTGWTMKLTLPHVGTKGEFTGRPECVRTEHGFSRPPESTPSRTASQEQYCPTIRQSSFKP